MVHLIYVALGWMLRSIKEKERAQVKPLRVEDQTRAPALDRHVDAFQFSSVASTVEEHVERFL